MDTYQLEKQLRIQSSRRGFQSRPNWQNPRNLVTLCIEMEREELIEGKEAPKRREHN